MKNKWILLRITSSFQHVEFFSRLQINPNNHECLTIFVKSRFCLPSNEKNFVLVFTILNKLLEDVLFYHGISEPGVVFDGYPSIGNFNGPVTHSDHHFAFKFWLCILEDSKGQTINGYRYAELPSIILIDSLSNVFIRELRIKMC